MLEPSSRAGSAGSEWRLGPLIAAISILVMLATVWRLVPSERPEGQFAKVVEQNPTELVLMPPSGPNLNCRPAVEQAVFEPRIPYARFAKGGLIDIRGGLYYGLDPGGLPIYEGNTGHSWCFVELHSLATAALAATGVRVPKIRWYDDAGWIMQLDNGWEVLLGHKELRARVLRLQRGYRGIAELNGEGNLRLDLRYPGGLAVDRTTVGEG